MLSGKEQSRKWRVTASRHVCRWQGLSISAWLFLGMVVVNIIPLWVWTYFPSQDGPAHLYNSFVLAHYYDSPLFQKFFELHWSPAGNALTHVLLAALLLVVSPALAERLVLTLYCAALPFAFRYAVRSWRPSDNVMSFAGFLLVYNAFLHLGFWNFCISIVLFLFAFGYLVRNATRTDWRTVTVMTLLALATYFAHIVSWFMLCLAGGVLFAGAVARRDFERLPLTGVMTLLPGIFALVYYSNEPRALGAASLTWRERLWSLYGVPFLRGFSLAETDLARVTAGCSLALLAGAAWLSWRRYRRLPWNHALALCAVCVAITIALPANGNFLQSRVALYAFVFLLLGVAASAEPGRAGPLVRTLLMGLSLVGILLRIEPYQHWNQMLAEYVQAGQQVRPNSTLLPVRYAADQDGRLRPTLHAAGLLVPRQFVDLYDYEAAFDYFPVQFKPERLPGKTLGWTTEFDHFPPVFQPRRYETATGSQLDFILVEAPERVNPWPEKSYSWPALANYELVYVSRPLGLVHLYRRILRLKH